MCSMLLLLFVSFKAFLKLLKKDTEWDRLNHLETDYSRFDIQLALLAKFESTKLEQYKDIFCDVLIPFNDIEMVELIGEGKCDWIYMSELTSLHDVCYCAVHKFL